MNSNLKICIRCNKEKSIDNFYTGNTKRSKKKCKDCIKLQDRENYRKRKDNNPDEVNRKQRERYHKNKESINENKRKNYDPEKRKKYYDPEKQKIYNRNYRSNETIRERIRKQGFEYRSRPEIKEHIKKKNKEYLPIKKQKMKEKRKNDIGFRLQENIKNHINRLFKSQDINKPTRKIIGIETKYFIKWFEFQFSNNETWDNYGKYWHADHIIPQSLFDCKNEEDMKICFHWTNYQPLSGKENMSKKNKIVLHHIMNNIITVHRFIQKYKTNYEGYQALDKSLKWLRKKLRYGKNPNIEIISNQASKDFLFSL